MYSHNAQTLKLYMVIYIEEEFGVDFGAKSIRDFKTLGDVVKFISEEA